MTIDEFRYVNEKYRSEQPKLFQLCASDKLASTLQIQKVEELIGAKLPADYQEFLKEFGGGSFGLLTIFSADPEGEWYLPRRVEEARPYCPNNLLPISDDFSGGYYALALKDNIATEPVLYWNSDDGGAITTEFETTLDFIARYAYKPA